MSESLAEQTERLLKRVQDWPLGVALDYLIDAGFSVLEGVRIVGRGRAARLKRRLKAVAAEMIGYPLAGFEVRKYKDGTRLFLWWMCCPPRIADGLSVWMLPDQVAAQVVLGWKEPHRYYLPEWCQASAPQFAERSLCNLFVLLWCIARCYARD